MKYNFLRKTKNNEKKVRLNKRVLLVVSLGVYVLIKVFLTLQVLGWGGQISRLEDEIESLSRKNKEIESKLAYTTSLMELEKKASELGFRKVDQKIYIDVEDVFAFLRK